MGDWFHIAKREYLERVQNKWFVIITLLGPVGMIALFTIPIFLQVESSKRTVKIGVDDKSGQFSGLTSGVKLPIPQMMNLQLTDVSKLGQDQRKKLFVDKKYDGYLTLEKNVLTGGDVTYIGGNTSDVKLGQILSAVVNAQAMQVRATEQGMEPLTFLTKVMQPTIAVQTKQLDSEGNVEAGRSGPAVFFLGYIWMFIMYMAIITYGVNVMRSVIEEKTTRVIEMLVSSVRPRDILFGKVLGVGLAGLTQLLIWLLFAGVLLTFHEEILSLFGLSSGALELPSMSLADVLVVVIYFTLGYFFFSALFAMVGAAVTTEQEAQQVQMPVMMLSVLPILCAQLVADDPRGTWAEILTMIPISSPTLMPMRVIFDGATTGQVVISLCCLVLALVLAMAAASKIYHAGIMRYGKRATLAEFWSWLRGK